MSCTWPIHDKKLNVERACGRPERTARRCAAHEDRRDLVVRMIDPIGPYVRRTLEIAAQIRIKKRSSPGRGDR